MRNRLSQVVGGILLIVGSASGLNAQSDVPLSPEEGGPRIFEVIAKTLNIREARSTSAPISTTLKRGTILNNLGCSRVEGRVWCDVQPLGGGPRGYAAARFLKPAVSPHGAVVTGNDDSALRAGKGEFDATGPIPCSKKPKGPMEQCQMGVARAGGGFATVIVTHPDGTKRALFSRTGPRLAPTLARPITRGPFRHPNGRTSTPSKSAKNGMKSTMQ